MQLTARQKAVMTELYNTGKLSPLATQGVVASLQRLGCITQCGTMLSHSAIAMRLNNPGVWL